MVAWRHAPSPAVRAWGVGLLLVAACSSGPIALGRLDDAARIAGTADAGIPVDAGVDAAPSCPVPAPTRHYAFDGTGTDVVDVRGGPSGRVIGGATLDGSGVLRLDGVDDYVDLPNGILAGRSEISIALWIRHLGHAGYTRIFDIGTGSLGEDPADELSTVGRSYLAATPATGNDPSGLAVLMATSGSGSEAVAASDVVLDAELRFVVAVVSPDSLSLYYEGMRVASVPRTGALASIVDHNAWLGRSQYSADPYIEADYSDVRIYDGALAECAVRALFEEGPNPL